MTHLLLGFLIALSVGLTGIGGGSFTVPALLLVAGLPPVEAVGTTFVFAGVLRLVAAPFYLATRQVHSRYFRLLLLGAVPGLAIGMVALRVLAKQDSNALIVLLVGILLTLSSSVSFVPRAQVPGFARKNSHWLPWLAFPIGVESGFSSAGAGALGTVLLLNYSEMVPAQVVGTDLVFGLVLATIGIQQVDLQLVVDLVHVLDHPGVSGGGAALAEALHAAAQDDDPVVGRHGDLV